MPVAVPASFAAMPRWWHASDADRRWLADLPRLVATWCRRWGLTVDGAARHGSNALVVPVRRGAAAAALRLAPPTDDVAPLSVALRFWRDDDVVVDELEVDLTGRAMLLERLGPDRLRDQPLDLAVHEIGRVARLLAVPVPEDVAAQLVHTSRAVARRTPQLRPGWERLGRPFPERIVAAAEEAATAIVADRRDPVAVNADLHFEQVLRAGDGRWCVIDPVLGCGAPERTAVNVLWQRVEEMDAVDRWVDVLVDAAGLDHALTRAWATWRTTDYWLWGLEHGLTEDPARCRVVLDGLGG